MEKTNKNKKTTTKETMNTIDLFRTVVLSLTLSCTKHQNGKNVREYKQQYDRVMQQLRNEWTSYAVNTRTPILFEYNVYRQSHMIMCFKKLYTVLYL